MQRILSWSIRTVTVIISLQQVAADVSPGLQDID